MKTKKNNGCRPEETGGQMVAKVLLKKARGLQEGQKEKARRARRAREKARRDLKEGQTQKRKAKRERGKARRGLKKGQPQKRKARREREKASRGLREGQKPKKKAREARKKRARRGLKEGPSLSLNTGKAGQTGTLFGKKGEAKGPEKPERLKGPKGQMCKKGGKGACRKATLQTKFSLYSQGPKSGG